MIAGRSPIVQLAIQAATPLALVLAAYALFAGHNRPGGGFAAGLLLGAVVVLRTVAGLSRPSHAYALLGGGAVVATLVSLAPLLWGGPVLDMVVVEFDMAVLDTVKTGTALIFDIGVSAIVVGLVVAVLDGFGAQDLSTPTDPIHRESAS